MIERGFDMRQRAIIVDTDGKTAKIAVSRTSMCSGCEKSGGCGGHCEITGLIDMGDRKMMASALNPIGAVAGDMVEVETESRTVLGYAALVFLLPIAVCAFGWWLGNRIWNTQTAGIIAAAAGFVLTFFGIAVFDRVKQKRTPDIVIVKKLENPSDGVAEE